MAVSSSRKPTSMTAQQQHSAHNSYDRLPTNNRRHQVKTNSQSIRAKSATVSEPTTTLTIERLELGGLPTAHLQAKQSTDYKLSRPPQDSTDAQPYATALLL